MTPLRERVLGAVQSQPMTMSQLCGGLHAGRANVRRHLDVLIARGQVRTVGTHSGRRPVRFDGGRP